MRVVQERRTLRVQREKQYKKDNDQIDLEQKTTQKRADELFELNQSRIHYAACKVQSVIRGFLARRFTAELLREQHAAIMIQKVVRGRFGRLKWLREFWKQKSVVKSNHALKLMLSRSKFIRQDEILKYGKAEPGPWKELFDPETNSIWYYNTRTRQNTWDCPLSLQKEFICKWNGFESFGGFKSQKRCRCIFSNALTYQGHLRTAHSWHCEACGLRNTGLTFPTCTLCGNTLSGEGEDGMKVVQETADHIKKLLKEFLHRDYKAAATAGYVLKDRVTAKVVTKRKEDLAAEAERLRLEAELEDDLDDSDNGSTDSSVTLSLWNSPEKDVADASNVSVISVAGKSVFANTLASSTVRSLVSEEDYMDLVLPQISPKTDHERRQAEKKNLKVSIVALPSRKLADPSVVSYDTSVKDRLMRRNGLPMPPQRRKELVTVLAEDTKNHILRGFITAADFDYVMNDVKQEEEQDDFEDEQQEENVVAEANKVLSAKSWLWDAKEIGEKMQVCRRYLKHQCTKTTCPLAHPGVRDTAAVNHARMPGKTYRVPYVVVCPNWPNECAAGNACDYYHYYIRPPTIEIIQKLYPIKQGVQTKDFLSGALMKGNVKRNKFNGYGVFTWPTGGTYVGDWVDDKRQGFGIFRTPTGAEYVGQWDCGLRHGWGILYHPNGEEYVGQWVNGKMHGVGRLSSRNGDVYEGRFENHKYNGIGRFTRKNGDKFMGYIHEGFAQGLGVQALISGEKYKGYFDRDVRHGKGACAYKNGSRYFGEWYRGLRNGFGVFLSGQGERYVGQWLSGKKHGTGRYMFANGDFYDGEFRNDKAQGMGVYYHVAEGNVFSGEWSNDKRNGRGTYNFSNGSKYTGIWVDNDIDGKGKFDYACGAFYRGQFKKNLKHGKGVFTWANLNVYKGTFVDDVMCGPGEMTYVAGHRYIGNWDRNKKNGFGAFYYAEGHVYEGNFVDDQRSGKGAMTWFKGSLIEESYSGDWVGDEKHGYGTYRYRASEGTVYEGEWVRGVREGMGKLTFKDKSFYRGSFYKEQIQGRGVFVGVDGSQYEGEWFANKKHGVGTLLDTDGSIYVGEFKDDFRHGNGRLLHAEGGEYIGVWGHGVIVGTGKFTLPCGAGSRGGPAQITMKVFGF